MALTETALPAQGPGQKNPDVSFDLGPQDTPVKFTLGRQQALDGGVSDDAQVRLRAACPSTDHPVRSIIPVTRAAVTSSEGHRNGQLQVS